MSRRARWSVGALLLLVAACNALTGADELEKVECVTCEGETGAEAGLSDTRPETADAPLDTRNGDGDASSDDGDAGDTEDSGPPLPDVGPDAKACFGDLDCNDLNGCTTDKCSKTGGATFGLCANTRVDGDGDGESPSALGICGTDCNDTNKDVFAKQTAWFASPYTDSAGASSYDYDCSGKAEPERPAVYKCTRVGSTCTITAGWQTTVPACGANGTWIASCTPNIAGGCTAVPTTVKQRCR